MNFTRNKTTALAMMALLAVSVPAGAQEASSGLKTNETTRTSQAGGSRTTEEISAAQAPKQPSGDAAGNSAE